MRITREEADRFRDLLAKNELEKLFQELNKFNKISEIITTQNNYTELYQKWTLNYISDDKYYPNKNKLIHALTILIEDLKNGKYEENLQEKNSEKINILKSERHIYLTEEDVFRLTKTAIIIIELEKVKDEFNDIFYYKGKWVSVDDVLMKLYKFSKHTNVRLAKAVTDFLHDISVRNGMPAKIAHSIFSLAEVYFPFVEKESEHNDLEQIGLQCVNIGDNIFYRATIKICNLKVAVYGLLILKWVYWKGKDNRLEGVVKEVIERYKELERALNRPERNDLEDAKKLLQIFKDDLDNRSFVYPKELSGDLYKKVRY